MGRALALVMFLVWPALSWGEGVVAARFADPTRAYDHGVLGDAIEHRTLVMETDAGRTLRLTLPETRVFEDTAPRVVDLDGDGAGEVIAVETDFIRGARLSVFAPSGRIAASPFIGRRHRWLAPAGAADFDGDGIKELASVDRPHLARVLQLWRFTPGQPALTLIAARGGLTNHRIGETDIAGGIRDCGSGPEVVTANADWTRIMATRYRDGTLTSRDIAPHRGRASFAAALACAE